MSLSLTVKPGETVRIGDDCTLTVVAVSREGHVRLAFDAPRSVTILRGNAVLRQPKPGERS